MTVKFVLLRYNILHHFNFLSFIKLKMYENLSVPELKKKCKMKNLSGYSTLNKKQLINLLRKKNMRGGGENILVLNQNEFNLFKHTQEDQMHYLTLSFYQDELIDNPEYEELFHDIERSLTSKVLSVSGNKYKIIKLSLSYEEDHYYIEIKYKMI